MGSDMENRSFWVLLQMGPFGDGAGISGSRLYSCDRVIDLLYRVLGSQL